MRPPQTVANFQPRFGQNGPDRRWFLRAWRGGAVGLGVFPSEKALLHKSGNYLAKW